MALRPSWSGFLKFNLVSVPVKGYSATASGGGKIGFHLLHRGCHQRIRYKKVCPVHGEIPNDEIVSGYEYAKGQYVTVEAEEKKGLQSEDDKAIQVDAFVPPGAIDPLYYSGRSYYLLPDGKPGAQPYAVLLDAMSAQERYGVARVVFAGRAHVAVVRPSGRVLVLTLLSYESEVKPPATFEAEVGTATVSAEERKLAEMLIGAATADDFDLAAYKDEYAGKLAELVEGKARETRQAAGEAAEPAVINLMDALRQSLKHTQKGDAKAGKKAAPHRARAAPPSRRRKTG